MQDELNVMGGTNVMLKSLAQPATPAIFVAALELGIQLLRGGHTDVQQTIYNKFSSGEFTASLANLVGRLQEDCRKVQTYFTELKTYNWYVGVTSAPGWQEGTYMQESRLQLSSRTQLTAHCSRCTPRCS